MIKTIHTNDAPKAIGPYSQGIINPASGLIFISGQIPLDARSMRVEARGIEEQTRVVLKNLGAVLKASGAGLQSVMKTTIYLKNMDDFAAVNKEYQEFFGEHKPARACIEVSRLPKDVLVEIDAIAAS